MLFIFSSSPRFIAHLLVVAHSTEYFNKKKAKTPVNTAQIRDTNPQSPIPNPHLA